jgi:hypothetical protein
VLDEGVLSGEEEVVLLGEPGGRETGFVPFLPPFKSISPAAECRVDRTPAEATEGDRRANWVF